MKIVVESIENNIVKLEFSKDGKIYFEYEKLEKFPKFINQGDILEKTKSGYKINKSKTENQKKLAQEKLNKLNKNPQKIINL